MGLCAYLEYSTQCQTTLGRAKLPQLCRVQLPAHVVCTADHQLAGYSLAWSYHSFETAGTLAPGHMELLTYFEDIVGRKRTALQGRMRCSWTGFCGSEARGNAQQRPRTTAPSPPSTELGRRGLCSCLQVAHPGCPALHIKPLLALLIYVEECLRLALLCSHWALPQQPCAAACR